MNYQTHGYGGSPSGQQIDCTRPNTSMMLNNLPQSCPQVPLPQHPLLQAHGQYVDGCLRLALQEQVVNGPLEIHLFNRMSANYHNNPDYMEFIGSFAEMIDMISMANQLGDFGQGVMKNAGLFVHLMSALELSRFPYLQQYVQRDAGIAKREQDFAAVRGDIQRMKGQHTGYAQPQPPQQPHYAPQHNQYPAHNSSSVIPQHNIPQHNQGGYSQPATSYYGAPKEEGARSGGWSSSDNKPAPQQETTWSQRTHTYGGAEDWRSSHIDANAQPQHQEPEPNVGWTTETSRRSTIYDQFVDLVSPSQIAGAEVLFPNGLPKGTIIVNSRRVFGFPIDTQTLIDLYLDEEGAVVPTETDEEKPYFIIVNGKVDTLKVIKEKPVDYRDHELQQSNIAAEKVEGAVVQPELEEKPKVEELILPSSFFAEGKGLQFNPDDLPIAHTLNEADTIMRYSGNEDIKDFDPDLGYGFVFVLAKPITENTGFAIGDEISMTSTDSPAEILRLTNMWSGDVRDELHAGIINLINKSLKFNLGDSAWIDSISDLDDIAGYVESQYGDSVATNYLIKLAEHTGVSFGLLDAETTTTFLENGYGLSTDEIEDTRSESGTTVLSDNVTIKTNVLGMNVGVVRTPYSPSEMGIVFEDINEPLEIREGTHPELFNALVEAESLLTASGRLGCLTVRFADNTLLNVHPSWANPEVSVYRLEYVNAAKLKHAGAA